MSRALAILAALLLPGVSAAQQAGDAFEIARTVDSEQHSTSGSTGTTHDRDAVVERVVAVTDAGVELEYDLPDGASAEDRARQWQFPARIFAPRKGPLQLRNRAELEKRIDKWLEWGEMQRSACGRWIFTWNAFKIECDPDAVLQLVAAFSLGRDPPVEGGAYTDAQAIRPAPLARKANGKGFTAQLTVDPEAIRNARIENEMVLAEISGKPLTREAARKAHAAEDISGTIEIDIDTDEAGRVRHRTKVVRLTIRSGGETETRTVTEVVERRPIRPARNPDSI